MAGVWRSFMEGEERGLVTVRLREEGLGKESRSPSSTLCEEGGVEEIEGGSAVGVQGGRRGFT